MAKLIEYDQVETLKDEDVFLIDGERGTKTIAAKNLANDINKVGLGESTEYTDNKFSELDDAKLDKTGDASNVTSDIQSATNRTNLTTGEKLAVSLGKIKKFFSDLKTVAFTGSYADLTEKPTSMAANGGNADTVNGHTVDTDVPADAEFTDTVYDVFVKSGAEAKAGLVPSPPTTVGADKYLREDGTWTVPPGIKYDSTVTGVKGSAETEYRTGNVNITAEDVGAVPIGGDTAENTTAFTAASTRENLKSGESHTTLFGKIAKWFSDLKAVAFSGSYNDLGDKPSIPAVANNNTTTESGFALDARQANPNVDGSLAKQISALNDGLKKYQKQDGVYMAAIKPYDSLKVTIKFNKQYIDTPICSLTPKQFGFVMSIYDVEYNNYGIMFTIKNNYAEELTFSVIWQAFGKIL